MGFARPEDAIRRSGTGHHPRELVGKRDGQTPDGASRIPMHFARAFTSHCLPPPRLCFRCFRISPVIHVAVLRAFPAIFSPLTLGGCHWMFPLFLSLPRTQMFIFLLIKILIFLFSLFFLTLFTRSPYSTPRLSSLALLSIAHRGLRCPFFPSPTLPWNVCFTWKSLATCYSATTGAAKLERRAHGILRSFVNLEEEQAA